MTVDFICLWRRVSARYVVSSGYEHAHQPEMHKVVSKLCNFFPPAPCLTQVSQVSNLIIVIFVWITLPQINMSSSYGRQTTNYNLCPWFNVQGQRENEKRFVFISMQSFLLSNGFMQNFVVFVKHTKLLSLLSHDFMQRRNTLYIKIKDGNPSIKSTRQMRARVDTTPKKKRKQTINKISCVLSSCYV